MNNRELKNIIKIFQTSNLSSMKLERDDVKIELTKVQPTTAYSGNQVVKEVVVNESDKSQSATEEVSSYTQVNAPLVGTFYAAKAPDKPPFVHVGQTVKKGDTLCIIEAMKVMNEITAPKDGTIKKIHVENGDMVMYDQTIMEID